MRPDHPPTDQARVPDAADCGVDLRMTADRYDVPVRERR